MATNESTGPTADDASYCQAAEVMSIVAYRVLTPVYFVFCSIGHVLCLISFRRQLKTETAYMYQLLLTVSQLLSVWGFCFYVVTWYWLGPFGSHPANWFMSCYGCVWVTVHFSIPLAEVYITSTLLLTVAMAADRAFALAFPVNHLAINHKRHQFAACAICIFISVTSSLFNFFRRGVQVNAVGTYGTQRTEFSTTISAGALEHVQDVIRAVATLLLLGLNICIIVLYRRKFITSAPISHQSEEMRRRRENEKMLIVIAFSQSFFTLCYMTDLIWGDVAMLVFPGWQQMCRGTFYLTLGDAFMGYFDMCDFGVMLIANKRFRAMIYEVTPSWFKKVVGRGVVADAANDGGLGEGGNVNRGVGKQVNVAEYVRE